MRSSLTSASAGRSQSHIKLSENPKVPVRSVNSSIVPAPPPPPGLKGPSVTRHPLQWSGLPPPHWVHRYSDTFQIHLQLLGVSQIEIEDSPEACFLFCFGAKSQCCCSDSLIDCKSNECDESDRSVKQNECGIRLR